MKKAVYQLLPNKPFYRVIAKEVQQGLPIRPSGGGNSQDLGFFEDRHKAMDFIKEHSKQYDEYAVYE